MLMAGTIDSGTQRYSEPNEPPTMDSDLKVPVVTPQPVWALDHTRVAYGWVVCNFHEKEVIVCAYATQEQDFP